MGKIRFRVFYLLLFFTFFISTCAFAGSTKYKTFPSKNDTSVNKEWTIAFNDNLDRDSVTPDSIKIINNRSGQRVPNQVLEILAGGKSVKIKPPAGGYEHITKYTLIVKGVKSQQGKVLAQLVQKEFVTEAPAQLTILGREDKVIENPDAVNIVTYQDKATVEIPANTVSSGTPVSIQEVSGARRHEFNDLETHATYDISIGATFTGDLTLRFKYDPSLLKAEYEPADQLVVAYFNEENQRWVEADFTLDKDNHEISVLTNHLSLWSIFGIEDNMVVTSAPNFKIYYNKNLNAPLLAGVDPNYATDPIYQFAAQVRTALVDAHAKYTADGFTPPAMTKVYIDDWGADATANWGWFSKNIEIPIQYDNLTELKHDCAHELFHAVQNQYLVFPTMVLNRWWMEATADYAAAELMGTKKYVPISATYLQKSLGTTDSVHEYQSARFVDYLARHQGINFNRLWEHTTSVWSADMVPVIGNYVATIKGTSFPDIYHDYARQIVFGDDNLNFQGAKSPYELATQTEMPLATKNLSKTFTLTKYSAGLWGIKPEIGSASPSRSLILELDEDLPAGVFADAFVLYDYQWMTGSPLPTATLQKAQQSKVVTVGPGQILFVLISNGTTEGNSATVKVSELDFTVDPAELEAQLDRQYDFTLKARNIPKEYTSVNFVWDFGDGESKDESNLSKGNEIVPVFDGKAETVISHKYRQDGNYFLEVEMLDLNDNTMSKAMATINIPKEEVTVSILPPRIITYELKDGATEATHDFEAVVTPAGSYRFDWDFGDGSPVQSVNGPSSSISHNYTGVGNYKPKVQVYDSTGMLLGEDSISVILEASQGDQVINISDPALATVIRNKLNKTTGDLMKSDLESLVELDASSKKISNLSGLEYAVNLQELNLTWNDIPDISPLAGLTNLKTLYLNPNLDYFKIHIDLSPLAGLTNLETLWIPNYIISDISPLSGLTKLKFLRLDCVHFPYEGHGLINDLTPIAGLVNLEKLQLRGNKISDITPLGKMSSLKDLYLDYNQITNISVLANLANLESLIISNNTIDDISPLSGLTSLWDIDAQCNQISDLNPLSGLTNLENLILNDNLIKDIEALSNLTKLSFLCLSRNQITDISVLKNLPALKYLAILDNDKLDLSAGSKAKEVIDWLKNRKCRVE